MLGIPPFYHKSIRNIIIAFGAIFNDISIRRFDKNDVVVDTIKIPLAYAPKEKMLIKLNQDIAGSATDGADVEMILPRMSFEITGISYDAIRQKSAITEIVVQNDADNTTVTKTFEPVPYNITIDLNIFAKYQDDSLQIVEQILPFFRPRFNVSIFETSLNVKRDIPILLESISYQDSYDGRFEERRAIIYTISFTTQANMYANIDSSGKIIRDITINIAHNKDMLPIIGEKLSRINIVPNPIGANPDDDFTFTTTITNPERT